MELCRRAGLLVLLLPVLVWSIPAAVAHHHTSPFIYLSGAYSSNRLSYPPASEEEMGWLLKQIASDDQSQRTIAAGALGQTRDPRAVEPLLKALGDRVGLVRVNAALSFVHMQDPRAVGELAALVKDRPSGLDMMSAVHGLAAQGDAGFEALMSLVAMGISDRHTGIPLSMAEIVVISKRDKASDWAIEQLKSVEKKYHGAAASVLDELRSHPGNQPVAVLDDPVLVKALLDLLLSDSEDAGRAVDLLAGVKDPAIIEKLTAAAKDPKHPSQELAHMVLHYDEECQEVVPIGHYDTFDEDDEDHEEFLPTTPVKLDMAQITELAKLARQARGHIETALHGEVAIEPFTAANRLARSGDPRAFEVLEEMIKGQDSGAATAAADVIARSRNAAAGDLLMKLATSSNYPEVVQAAATLQTPNAAPFLIALLKHGNQQVVETAIRSLGAIKDRRATAPLIELLANPELRHFAAQALFSLKDPIALDTLVLLMNERESAKGGNAPPYVTSFAEYGSDAVEKLLPGLSDPNLSMRLNVAEVFTMLRDPRAVASLIKALDDENQNVRRMVARALLYQGSPEAVAALTPLLNDTDTEVRRYAVRAVVISPVPAVVQLLVPFLNDTDHEIQVWAAVALGLLGDARGAEVLVKALDEQIDPQRSHQMSTELFDNAIKAAAILKDKRAAGAIISALAQDIGIGKSEAASNGKHAQLREALKAIAGQDFGEAYYRWMAWWVAQGNRLPIFDMSYESY